MSKDEIIALGRTILKPDIFKSRIRVMRKRDELGLGMKPGTNEVLDDLYIGGLVNFANDELQVRAKLARETLCRILAQSSIPAGDLIKIYDEIAEPLGEDLRKIVDAELSKVRISVKIKNQIPVLMDMVHADAIKQQKAELEIFSAAPASIAGAPTNINVGGNVYGVIQTGAHSTAKVQQNIDAAAASELREILANLREELQKTNDSDETEAALVLIDKANEELAKPEPAMKKVGGFLTGLSAVVSTVSNAPGAYHALKLFAAAHNIPLP